MERMEQQAAGQTKMSRKGDNLSPLQYVAISEKGKSEKLCLSLLKEILQDEKKKISVFITDCSYALAPRRSPLSSAVNSFPHGFSSRKQVRQTSPPPRWSYWSIGSCPMVCCTARPRSRLGRGRDVESGTGTLRAPLQRLSHILQQNHVWTSNTGQRRWRCMPYSLLP